MVETVDVQRKVVNSRKSAPPTKRGSLTGELVVAKAVELADAEGIDGLSMRTLARALGVEAMSLYHYFPSKAALLDAMLESVYADYGVPSPSASNWRAELSRTAISAHRALLRHPWACRLQMTPTSASRNRMEWMDAVLGTLREAGFSTEMTHHAYHALDSHIVGFTLWLLPYIELTRNDPGFAQRALDEMPVQGLPHLIEHIDYHLDLDADRVTPSTNKTEFEFGLDLLLDGFERLRA